MTKRKRSPDEIVSATPPTDNDFVPESPQSNDGDRPKRQCTSLTSTSTSAAVMPEPPTTVSEAPGVDRAAARSSRGWKLLRGRLRVAVLQVRVLLFVHVADEKKCLRVRGHLQFLAPRLGWMALYRVNRAVTEATDDDVGQALEALDTYDEPRLDGVLLSLVVLVLLGLVQEHRPLLSKLPVRRRRQLEHGLSRGVGDALANPGPQRDRPNFAS